MPRPPSFLILLMPLLLAACDQLGIESATAVQARREAEGKAIGGGCRLSARSVEVCFTNNKRADKSAVFAGWRDMNDYMRENKIDAMPPPPEPPKAAVAADGEEGDDPRAKEPKDAKPSKPTKVAVKAH